MQPGIRVIRGPDWCHGNEDGGPGYLGTVIKFLSNNTVTVQWDTGSRTICRAGQNGHHELRIYDNAQIGIEFRAITCDERSCKVKERMEIFNGMRWKCLVCYDTDYCTTCYMTSLNDCINHPFVRYYSLDSVVVRVPPRRHSKKIPLYGIFQGAKVTKLVNDGITQKQEAVGTVTELVDIEQSYRGAVKVDWSHEGDGTGDKSDLPIYRIGAEGKVELKLVSAVSPGTVFIEHLPLLDLTVPMESFYHMNDVVRMDQHLETFKALMNEHSGWIPDLEKVLGEEGVITEVRDVRRHIVSVKYDQLDLHVRVMYTNVLTKVTKISADDYVDIIEDESRMKELQKQHGGWPSSWKSILGATGKVLRIEGHSEAIVDVNGYRYLLNIACLKPRPPDTSLSGSLRRSLRGDKSSLLPSYIKYQPLQGTVNVTAIRILNYNVQI